MASARIRANELATKRQRPKMEVPIESASEMFGKYVFNRSVMQKMLPKKIYRNLLDAMEGRQSILPEYADAIATAMKEWAMQLGATHYCHWFQPLTGASAEKHDAFIDWQSTDKVIEKFSGKQLVQGEPDASSFPSGGLRSTYEARGYTGWDPSSPAFVWHGGDGVTLCIPSVFFSWAGDVLDTKIPLLRSDRKINTAVLRLLKVTGVSASYVFSTLGLEQEYFVIDRALRNLRPDLVLLGKTVFGALPPKGQELQDHYFGAVKDRVLAYMCDFEIAAFKLGIPVKTRHNEVAPAQHEVAPVYERASTAIDHNILLMELMRQIAVKHDLACLLHEKPFQGLNGSGKHSNWALSTDTGINLLDPTDNQENNIHFIVLLAAILHAVHTHADLLRASIGGASNDYRLGGHEAPPAIISVYLGQELENLLNTIEKEGTIPSASKKEKYDLGVHLGDLKKEATDRNRTSPFAFTGNKFEFRAVGSSANPAISATVLNAIVAESLNTMMDEIEAKLKNKKSVSNQILLTEVMPVVQKYIRLSKPVRFSGDNYCEEWIKEAKKRGLPNIKKSIEAFAALKSASTQKTFEGILTREELQSRHEIVSEIYCLNLNIEANLMVDMFRTQILPSALSYQKQVAKSLNATTEALGLKKQPSKQKELLVRLMELIEKAIDASDQLNEERIKAAELALDKRGNAYAFLVIPCMEALREVVDQLEEVVDDTLWQLPKYRELLFLI